MIYTKERIQQALELPDFDVPAAHALMTPVTRGSRPADMPGQAKQGAVLAIIYAKDDRGYVVLTRRRHDLNNHAGQISFPGGQQEPGESRQITALREAQEEIGVLPENLDLLGHLSTIYIPPTDFEVHPFVAWHLGSPSFIPQDSEVAEILEVPLTVLLEPAARQVEIWDIRGRALEIPFYSIGEHKIWGATAIIMSELIERLKAVT